MTPSTFLDNVDKHGVTLVLLGLAVIIAMPTIWMFLNKMIGNSQTRIDNKDTVILEMAKESTRHIATNTETMRMLAEGQNKVSESIVRMEQTLSQLVVFQKERADRVDASFERVVEDIRDNRRSPSKGRKATA